MVLLSAGAVAAQDQDLRFDVEAFDVSGNTVLPGAVVEAAVYPHMGPGRTPADVEAARSALQAAYEARGYPTATVTVPDQSVDGGVIRLDVVEQRIGSVEVAGARFFDPQGVRRDVPSLAEGVVPNFDDVQADIVAANQFPDRRVTPELTPGATPGTVDVKLTVEDTYPLHGSVELNNRGSAQTTDLRLSAAFRYDNVADRGDSLGISTSIAPERTGDGLVMSANYLHRLPWNSMLLTAYAVHSESDIAVVGDINVLGAGDLIGVRLVAPLPGTDGFYHSLTAGFDYKDFAEQVTLGADRDSAPIEYYPFTAGWRGDWMGGTSQTNLGFSAIFGLRGLGDPLEAFDRKRFKARPNFFYLRGEAAQTQDYADGSQFHVSATGQWSAEPLISNEQFSIGGLDTVRGYFESETLGDYGFAIQAEMRTAPVTWFKGLRVDELRFHSFWDSGFVGIHDPLPEQDDGFLLMSTGVGARVRLIDYVNGSVDVAVPLLDGPDKSTGDVIIRFRLWGEF